MLVLVKTVHTAVFFFMSACILYILYAGITQTYNLILLVAIVAVLLESIVYLGNGRRCPLTELALRYGDPTGDDWFADIFLPEWAARLVFPVCGALTIVGLVVMFIGWIAAWG